MIILVYNNIYILKSNVCVCVCLSACVFVCPGYTATPLDRSFPNFAAPFFQRGAAGSEGSVATGVLIQTVSEVSSYRLSHTGRPEAEGRRQCGKWYFDLDCSERSELRF